MHLVDQPRSMGVSWKQEKQQESHGEETRKKRETLLGSFLKTTDVVLGFNRIWYMYEIPPSSLFQVFFQGFVIYDIDECGQFNLCVCNIFVVKTSKLDGTTIVARPNLWVVGRNVTGSSNLCLRRAFPEKICNRMMRISLKSGWYIDRSIDIINSMSLSIFDDDVIISLPKKQKKKSCTSIR